MVTLEISCRLRRLRVSSEYGGGGLRPPPPHSLLSHAKRLRRRATFALPAQPALLHRERRDSSAPRNRSPRRHRAWADSPHTRWYSRRAILPAWHRAVTSCPVRNHLTSAGLSGGLRSVARLLEGTHSHRFALPRFEGTAIDDCIARQG